MPPSTLDDVLYIKELSFNFAETEANINPIPIVLDATTEYSKRYSADITSHPVGDKTNRSDNYRVDLPTITFSGIISNLDIGLYEWAFNSESISSRTEGNGTGILNRAQQYVERLEDILNNKKLVEIRIPNGLTTTNCMITSLNITRRGDTGDAFEISISAKQINIVSTSILSEPFLNVLEEEKSVGASTTIPVKTLDLTPVEAEEIVSDPNVPLQDKLESLQVLRENSQ